MARSIIAVEWQRKVEALSDLCEPTYRALQGAADVLRVLSREMERGRSWHGPHGAGAGEHACGGRLAFAAAQGRTLAEVQYAYGRLIRAAHDRLESDMEGDPELAERVLWRRYLVQRIRDYGLPADRAARSHPGIPIDTPAQTRAVLAERGLGTAPAAGPAVGPSSEGADAVVHAGDPAEAGA